MLFSEPGDFTTTPENWEGFTTPEILAEDEVLADSYLGRSLTDQTREEFQNKTDFPYLTDTNLGNTDICRSFVTLFFASTNFILSNILAGSKILNVAFVSNLVQNYRFCTKF